MKRTLTLHRETLADLTTDELTSVHGAAFERTIVATVCDEYHTGLRCFLSFTTCITCE